MGVHVALARARIVVVTAIHFVAVTVLMTIVTMAGPVGLVAVVEAGLVFVTLIVVVLMVCCVLVMDRAMSIV